MQKKIFFNYLIVILISIIIIGFFAIRTVEESYMNNVEDKLKSNTKLVRSIIKQPLTEGFNINDYYNLPNELISELEGTRITIIDKDGIVVADSSMEAKLMDNHLDRPEVIDAINKGFGKNIRYSDSIDSEMIYTAVPININGEMEGIIRLSMGISDIKNVIRQIWNAIFIAVFISISIAIILNLKFSRDISRPIKELKKAAVDIAEGDYEKNISIKSDDELKDLAETFNDMSWKLSKTMDELTDKKKELEAILTSMVDNVIAIDKNSRIILINPSAEKLLNINKKDILGKHILEIARNYELYNLMKEVLETKEVSFQELKILSNEDMFFRVHITPIMENNEVAGVVAVLRNITERKKLEQIRTEFVANVSHELKTPLTSIKGFIETLLDGAHREEKTRLRFLEIIDIEVGHLTNMINDLLELSKIENIKSNLKKEKVNIKKILEGITSIFEKSLKGKNITLELIFPEEFPEINGNIEWIRLVFINLIDNSIKYNKENGSIKVTGQEGNGKAVVIIEDTGIGIPKNDIPRLFERFYRVDKARSRDQGGTGLGLAIVKHAIKAMDGEILVESEIGRGSKFILYFNKYKDEEDLK